MSGSLVLIPLLGRGLIFGAEDRRWFSGRQRNWLHPLQQMLLTLGVENVQGTRLKRCELLHRAIARLVGPAAIGNGRSVAPVLLQGATPALHMIPVMKEFGSVVLGNEEVLWQLLVLGDRKSTRLNSSH